MKNEPTPEKPQGGVYFPVSVSQPNMRKVNEAACGQPD